MLLSVIVPVFNEKTFIAEVLDRIAKSHFTKEIIVVDDGSSDGTRDVLDKLHRASQFPDARYFFHDRNQGKGAALRTGIAHARGDIVLIQDADFEYDPSNYPALVQPILDGEATVVYGSRFLSAGGRRAARNLLHYTVNQTLTRLSNLLTNQRLSDMETGFKVFRRELIQSLQIQENRFGFEPEITAKIARMGVKIREVPISYTGRSHSEGKKIGWKDGVSALFCIARYSLFPTARAPIQWALCLALAGIAATNLAHQSSAVNALVPTEWDELVRAESSLEKVRSHLVNLGYTRGHVGLLTPNGEYVFGNGSEKELFQVRYSLAPLLIDMYPSKSQFLVGHFMHAAATGEQIQIPQQFEVILDAGQGVYLLKRRQAE